MDFLPYSQEYMLAVSVMGGMLLGFIWDIYRLIRHFIKLGTIGTAAGDLAYWIISCYFSIQLIYTISYGNIRFFILLGFLLGALLYFYGISTYILKTFISIIDMILYAIKKVAAFMIAPIKFIFRKIKAFLYPYRLKAEKEREKIKRRYKFFVFRTKKVFKNKKMLYNKKKRDARLKKYRSGKRNGKGAKAIERRTKDNRTKKKNQQRRL